jgi:serine protease Do
MNDLIRELNDEMSGAVEDVRRSLVSIHNGHGGAGAGTIWRPDGLIVTNAHVVRGRHGLKVTLPDNRTLPARLLAHDDQHDLAALAVDATGLATIQVGDSRLLKAGQWVMAIGHPYGVAGAVTAGIVIGEGAQLPEMAVGGNEWIAVSLHMRPGHSGGPLVDIDGRLVGINTMITGPDVGMAIPVHIVKDFLRRAGLNEPAAAAESRTTGKYV